MPENMDITTFYKHALQWKHQQEEADRFQAEEMAESIRQQWKRVADMIRTALPIEGMILMETEAGQFEQFPLPGRLIDLDCVIDPSIKDEVAHGQGDLMRGVIRVRLYWDNENQDPQWKILKYIVRLDDKSTEFENPYDAFLQAFKTVENSAP